MREEAAAANRLIRVGRTSLRRDDPTASHTFSGWSLHGQIEAQHR
jgi:hypothetical protein